MIIDLPSTSTSAINRRLVDLRETGGAVALGRVLSLVICTGDEEAEEAIAAANDASREHPCRVLVVARGSRRGASRLDGQIRVGGDAGASEVVVARLYGELARHGDAVVVPLLLPDAPVVAWWPGEPPAVPSQDPIGSMAQRRITDSGAARRPLKALQALAAGHSPGDTDLAWSRVTLWRGLLAAALDQAPYDAVDSAVVTGAEDSPSADLLAAWLGLALGCPVTRVRSAGGTGVVGVRLERRSGAVELVRPEGDTALLTAPGQPERKVALPHRSVRDCLSEELRRLDPDEVYGDVLTEGMRRLGRARRLTEGAAAERGAATSRGEAQQRLAGHRASERETADAVRGADPQGAPPAEEPTDDSEVVTQAPVPPAPEGSTDGARAVEGSGGGAVPDDGGASAADVPDVLGVDGGRGGSA
ncbi:glucose-6-phosphate dehydrogenase assembly protein OpcA [uncultured Pseudokineococcus sp.]|uniref:glucose-6-phosphate dehydrogenase assembly protein OpcA n=1 Tax=uncultured Pseudokineococcus sp. TaxID=1642928 RepID=UPI002606D7B6|nr:glucose-6-phosphate dehydrogenase assembly protein OpcA [uncultured Pseudokineococcus sp.]